MKTNRFERMQYYLMGRKESEKFERLKPSGLLILI